MPSVNLSPPHLGERLSCRVSPGKPHDMSGAAWDHFLSSMKPSLAAISSVEIVDAGMKIKQRPMKKHASPALWTDSPLGAESHWVKDLSGASLHGQFSTQDGAVKDALSFPP